MNLQIERVGLIEIALPLREPFRSSKSIVTTRRLLLTELIDTDGRRVWGECAALETPDYLPETVDGAWDILREHLVPLLLSQPFELPSDVSTLFEKRVRGNLMAKAALEMPMWALAAEKEDLPLARYIGGKRNAVDAGVAIGLQSSTDELSRKVTEAFDEGYKRVKMKIAPDRDLRFVEAATHAAGGGDRIQLDANCAYSLADLETLKAIDAYGVKMIEQPMAWNDLKDHARLQAQLKTSICLDESIDGPGAVREMLSLEAGRIVCLKPGRVGGLDASLAIHDVCVAKNVPLWIGGMLESGIGRAYTVALASKSGVTLPGDLSPSKRYWYSDIVTQEWEMTETGEVTVPLERPGIGVDIDLDRVYHLINRREEFVR